MYAFIFGKVFIRCLYMMVETDMQSRLLVTYYKNTKKPMHFSPSSRKTARLTQTHTYEAILSYNDLLQTVYIHEYSKCLILLQGMYIRVHLKNRFRFFWLEIMTLEQIMVRNITLLSNSSQTAQCRTYQIDLSNSLQKEVYLYPTKYNIPVQLY